MSNDAGIDRLNGVSTGDTVLQNAQGQPITIHDNQTLPFRPVKHYRQVKDSRDRNVARNSGTLGAAGYGGPAAGTVWDTPSTLDGVTVLGENLNVSYVDPNGLDWTVSDMVIELFKDLQKRQGTVK
jgi:hypothetical protein